MAKSKITFTDIHEVDLGSFGTAVRDWEDMQADMQRLSRDAQVGMQKKAEGARWAGANADVTRTFVRKIADEVGDLHTESKSIWKVLKDAHQELRKIQSDVKNEYEKAKAKGIRVVDMGDGTVACDFADQPGTFAGPYQDYVHAPPEDAPKHSKAEYEAMEEIERRINSWIAKAGNVDATAAQALRKSHGGDPHDAGHASYSSLDDAQAERAEQLAQKQLRLWDQGKELSTKELAEMSDLFKYNGKDAEFSTSFYRDMGQKDALRFHAQMGVDASTDGGGTRLDLARSVQNHMGVALATATEPSSMQGDKNHLGTAWVNELKSVGRKPLALGQHPFGPAPEPLGYQILGNVLRHGNYDTKFLNDVGNDMITFERENPGGASPWPRPDSLHSEESLNLDKKGGAGYDPMTGLMEALGNSPEASTDFFNGSTGGEGELKKVSNFDYFLGDENGKNAREWYPDVGNMVHPDNKDEVFGKDAMGRALESATTGDIPGKRGHSQEQVELFEKVVGRFGSKECNDQIQSGGTFESIGDNLGNMSADYMHDIQRYEAGGSESKLFGSFGSQAGFERVEGEGLKRFLQATAQDPTAFSAISHAQQAVSTEAISSAVANPPGDMSDAAIRAAQPGAAVSGYLAEGRSEGIAAAEDRVGKAEEYNESLENGGKWAGRIIEMGVSKVPVAGDAIGWVTEDIQDSVFENHKKDPNAIAHQVKEGGDDYVAESRRDTAEVMKRATLNAARQQGYHVGEHSMGAAAADDVYSSFVRK